MHSFIHRYHGVLRGKGVPWMRFLKFDYDLQNPFLDMSWCLSGTDDLLGHFAVLVR